MIEQKIKECKLFLMAITPNSVEKGNYVITTEYPLAKKEEKDIIPIEMLKTDEAILSECYLDMPMCISKEDEKLNQLIAENFLPMENSPKLDFLIGLEYLYGENREINHDIAVELITNAAEQNEIDAVKKLKNVYYYGQAVPQDFGEAIRWQRKLVDILEKKYRKEKQLETMDKLLTEYLELGEILENLHKNLEAKRNYEKAKSLAKEVLKRSTANILNSYIQIELKYIALSAMQTKNKNEQLKLEKEYSELVVLCEKLLKLNSDVTTLHNVMCVYIYRAQLRYEMGKDKKANEDFTKAERLNFFMKKFVEEETYFQNEIGILLRKGDLNISYGEYEQAERDFCKAIELCQEWIKVNRSEEALRNLSISYEYLGDFYRDCKQEENARTKALEYFEKSIEITKELNENGETFLGLMDLSSGYRRIGGIKELFGCIDDAMEYYEDSAKILERLEAQDSSAEIKLLLASAFDDMGDIHTTKLDICIREKKDSESNMHFNEALKYFQKAKYIREKVIEKENATDYLKRELQLSYDKLGRLYMRTEHDKECFKYFDMELQLCHELVAAAPDNRAYQYELFVAYIRFGETYINMLQDSTNAKKYFQKALDLAEKLGQNRTAEMEEKVQKLKMLMVDL